MANLIAALLAALAALAPPLVYRVPNGPRFVALTLVRWETHLNGASSDARVFLTTDPDAPRHPQSAVVVAPNEYDIEVVRADITVPLSRDVAQITIVLRGDETTVTGRLQYLLVSHPVLVLDTKGLR